MARALLSEEIANKIDDKIEDIRLKHVHETTDAIELAGDGLDELLADPDEELDELLIPIAANVLGPAIPSTVNPFAF